MDTASVAAAVSASSTSQPVGAFELRPEDESLSVEAFLQVTCDRLVKDVLASAEGASNRLRSSFRAEKTSILSAYDSSIVTAAVEKQVTSAVVAASASTSVSSSSAASVAASKPAASGPQRFDVEIEVMTGPHKGKKAVLKPRQRRLVPKIGRSTGPQFIKNGVSLPMDEEISTTHAKLEARSGSLWITDLESTNGTFMDGAQFEAGVAYALPADCVIKFGQSEIRLVTIEA